MLVIGRNYLFKQVTTVYPQLVELTNRNKALLYLLLISSVILLMLYLTHFSLTNNFIVMAIGVAVVLNFWLILTLHSVLTMTRQYKQLVISLLFTLPVILTIGLVVGVELSFLYWIKDVEIYFQTPFWQFVLGYSLIIGLIASYLSLTTDQASFQKNGFFIVLAVLDPIIMILLTILFLQIILTTIYYSF